MLVLVRYREQLVLSIYSLFVSYQSTHDFEAQMVCL